MAQKNHLVEIIKKSLPAVVTIVVSKNFKELGEEKPIDRLIPFKGKGFDSLTNNKKSIIKTGSGSGFIIDESGLIISNRHVVSDLHSKYTIITNDGGKFEAKVIARDPISDVAMLKIEGRKKFPILKLGDSSRVNLGETVIAIGNALGIFQNTVSAGIISGLSRSISAQIDTSSPFCEIHGLIQTDAAINPGNSGGPLINNNGEVIGINIAVISEAENIGFALPINAAKKDFEDLKKYGHIRRPFLGIHYMIIDERIKNRFNLSINSGALIKSEKPYSPSIIPKSPAYLAGLKEKDIILEFNGQKVSGEKTITDLLNNCSIGDVIKLRVLRRTRFLSVNIKLSERR